MTTAEKITRLRKGNNLTQEQFAEMMSVSRQAVSKWENNTAQPTAENMAAISKLFGVPLSFLLDDEDVAYREEKVSLIAPQPRETEDSKIFKRRVKAAVITLAVITIALSVENIRLNRRIDSLENSIEERISRRTQSLQNQIYNLQSNINRPQVENTADFVDSDISVESYNHQSDVATLRFSFIPADYSRSTVAKVGVKSSVETKEAVATLENGMFVARIDVQSRDDISTYVYLIDGDKTRSFSMGMIENPAEQWKINLSSCSFRGKTKLSKGRVDIDGYLDVEFDYHIDPSGTTNSVYPKKALVEIYDGKRLIKTIPHTDAMNFDYYYNYEDLTNENSAPVAVGDWVMFGLKIKETIVEEKLTNASDIRFVYVVVDNNGQEYRRTAAFVVE